MSKMTAKQIIGALGREELSKALGVTRGAINAASNKGENGILSASWYAKIKSMCDKIGMPLPLDVFSWKSPPPFDHRGEIIEVSEYA